MDTTDLKRWFCEEVLPLEASLTRFIRRHAHGQADIEDLRQEIYERVLLGAERELPRSAAGFIFTIARHHLINQAKRMRIVPFVVVADPGGMLAETDALTPERTLAGREELRRVEACLARLPVRCREIVRLRKIEGLSTREVADRLGIGHHAVEQQTSIGVRRLANYLSEVDDEEQIASVSLERRP